MASWSVWTRRLAGRRIDMRRVLVPLAAIAVCAVAVGHASSKEIGSGQLAEALTARPTVVYVTNFELDAANIQNEQSFRPRELLPRGPLSNLRPGPLARKDPETRAHDLVELMADSLARDLQNDGFRAQRLAPGQPAPHDGWLVRGIFTEVDEGNRLRRAIIGFGAGKTELQVYVAVDDLTKGDPKPLYAVSKGAESGHMPGAIITLNPVVAAAKFALAGWDLDRNVMNTASQIATDLAGRLPK